MKIMVDDCLVGCLWPSQLLTGQSGHRMYTTASRFNVGLLAWAGRRGGGGLAPGSSEGVAAASRTRRRTAEILLCLGLAPPK